MWSSQHIETFRIYLVSDVKAMREKLDVVLTTYETFRIYLVSDVRAMRGKLDVVLTTY